MTRRGDVLIVLVVLVLDIYIVLFNYNLDLYSRKKKKKMYQRFETRLRLEPLSSLLVARVVVVALCCTGDMAIHRGSWW